MDLSPEETDSSDAADLVATKVFINLSERPRVLYGLQQSQSTGVYQALQIACLSFHKLTHVTLAKRETQTVNSHVHLPTLSWLTRLCPGSVENCLVEAKSDII